jgi:AraC-like DNA-binding protein
LASAGLSWESTLPGQPGATRFSTDDLPERDRVAIFREIVARTVVRNDVEPLSDGPFYVHSTVRALPGLFAYWSKCSPNRLSRGAEFLSDGNDSLVFSWTKQPRLVETLGREIPLAGGDAILTSCADAYRKTMLCPLETVTVSMPRKAFAPLLRDFDACLAHPVRGNSAALNLMLQYIHLLRDESLTSTPELQELAVTHVYDLVALALGATRDAAETARRRGVSAARLQAIKSSIRERLVDGGLLESAIAARHRITPRYLQMLFEGEGTTFTAFVLDQRLARVRSMLASSRFANRKIVEIALECGFGDISYFNRTFRMRYGMTPSDVRNGRTTT